MKFKTKKIGILLIIGLILPLLLVYSFDSFESYKTTVTTPKFSAGYIESFIHIDGSIPGNWSATTSYGWCRGDGSWSNPYIIENVTIDASSSLTGNGILIENSKNEYFIIRNCTVYNSGSGSYDAGIRFDNSCNGTIINNFCSNNGRNGITLRLNCENNTISGNTVNSNTQNGIYLYDNCDYNNITGNTGSDNNNGIQLFDNCHNNNITGNILNNNRIHGLRLDYCDNNRILSNTVNFNAENGIYVYSGEWNNITNNSVNSNKLIGIRLRFFCFDNIIENNIVNGNDLGILLQQSYFTNVSENTLNGNNYCIYELSSSGNIISNNDCTSPTVQLPISIDGDATGVGAHNWTWAESQTWCSGSGTWSDPYIIENLVISGFGAISYGIEIKDSDVFFIIRNCKIYHAIENGIYLDYVNNSLIINNNCSNNGYAGIALLYRCTNNSISENTANNNDYCGIYLYNENYNNTISINTVNNNGDIGLSLHWYSNNTIITGNVANDNGNYGLELYDWCGYNTVSNNMINDNGERGIDLEYQSNYNIFSNNIIHDNGLFGVYLAEKCNGNSISQNDIKNNSEGIRLETECDNTIITENILSDNTQYGIYSRSGGEDESNDYSVITDNILHKNNRGIYLDSYSNYTEIYKNFFLNNEKHAIDDGFNNEWNSLTIGNYWDNHTGPDESPQDGIVDNPYIHIGGVAGSIDFLPIAEDGPPQIIINTPQEGEIFTTVAPTFNVTVIDIYVYEMWYTIDGGIHNYTVTGMSGSINQSVWDSLADGTIIFTFYARDIIGNIGSAEVNILKRISSPGGLTPEMIIFIITVSVLGGIAIIGVILGRLIKTGKISMEKLKSFSLRKK